MALMYCYGSGFHISKTRNKCDQVMERPNGVPPACKNGDLDPVRRIPPPARPHSASTSRTMAAMSLGFIVMVTPATIQEVVAACTGCKVPPILDFVVTWLALSNSFWNPFLYWLLNSHFRRISSDLLQFYICCRRPKSFPAYDKPVGCCGSPITSDGLHSKGEFEGLGEKYWGEILERTVSSTSLHAIQKACHRDHLRCTGSFKGCPSSACKHDARFFDGYGPTEYRSTPFQIEPCSRHGRLKSSDICLFRPNAELEYDRTRSNLSLDESNFSKCNEIDHFGSNIKWKFNDSPGAEGDLQILEHNLDRIRSLSHDRSFNGYEGKDMGFLEVEMNDVNECDSDETKDYVGISRESSEEKSEYSASHKFSRTSSLSNRELDVIKESSRSSSDTEVTLTR
ncbi:unnamed protein product [Plutella xylostella]|uniref:(diamondback moth) hypothetical protein n=1 Tax=Plutella xylostella TaxID=51655 RepID=A0A8S4G255_PLUXY|nr:unnamed protein product [Plutella xylostella]